MLTDMGICVESANGSGIEFLSEKELSKTHNLCKKQGTSKAGDGIIFWGNVLHYGPESKQDRLFLYAAFGTDKGGKCDSTLCKLESATQPIYYDTLLQKHEISDKKLTEERDYAKSELKKVRSLAEDDDNIHCVRGVKKDGAFGLFRAIQDSFVAMLQYYYSKKPSSDVFQDSKIKELMVAVCVDRENGHLKLKDMTCTWLEKYLLGGMPSNSNFDDVRESELASEDLIFSNDITKRCFKDNALTLEVKAKLIQDIQQRGYTTNYNSGLLILMVTQKVLSQFATLHITTFDRTKPPILRTTNIDCLKKGDTGRARNEGAYKLRLLYYRLLGHYDIFFSHHKQDQRAANLNAAYYEAFLLQLCTLRSGRFVVKKSLTESFGVSVDVGRGLYAAWPIVKGDVIGWFPQSDTDESPGNEGNYRYSNDKLEYDNYKQSCLMSQDVDSGTLCCKPLETEAETMGLAPFINYSKSPNCKALWKVMFHPDADKKDTLANVLVVFATKYIPAGCEVVMDGNLDAELKRMETQEKIALRGKNRRGGKGRFAVNAGVDVKAPEVLPLKRIRNPSALALGQVLEAENTLKRKSTVKKTVPEKKKVEKKELGKKKELGRDEDTAKRKRETKQKGIVQESVAKHQKAIPVDAVDVDTRIAKALADQKLEFDTQKVKTDHEAEIEKLKLEFQLQLLASTNSVYLGCQEQRMVRFVQGEAHNDMVERLQSQRAAHLTREDIAAYMSANPSTMQFQPNLFYQPYQGGFGSQGVPSYTPHNQLPYHMPLSLPAPPQGINAQVGQSGPLVLPTTILQEVPVLKKEGT